MSEPARNLDLGAIGNGRALALVDDRGGIVWWCAPRFDSPSVFAELLDEERGGVFRIEPSGPIRQVRREYLPNTNCLRTTFETEDGDWEMVDFAPWTSGPHRAENPLDIYRLVRPLRGQPALRIRFDPRPHYGTSLTTCMPYPRGIVAHGKGSPVYLTTKASSADILEGRPIALKGPLSFTVSFGTPSLCRDTEEVGLKLQETVRAWRSWVQGIALPGIAPQAVIRSALALRLHMYEDTGAIISAATTSIPEALGSGRNWDYRYCWLRDAAYAVEAFGNIGLLSEGERFIDFLQTLASTSGDLQPVYGLAGELDLEERVLPHFSGFQGHGPVRIGNAAAKQVQSDVYGETLLALIPLLTDPRIVRDDREEIFERLRQLVEKARAWAAEKDTGIWEFRTKLRHYTHSKAMCWAALDRGAELARTLGRPELERAWRQEADRLREEILRRGFNSRLGFFTQAFDGEFPDAANLLLARIDLLPARDPRFVSTVRGYEKALLRNGLMLRYVNEDDFGPTTSAFLLCSFWWAEALALMGEVEKSEEVFASLLERANSLGLFSEDVDPATGQRLGNFPQAYTHVGVITTALAIGSARSRRP